MTLRDRGNKKWTAMMLPEHVAQIRQYYRDDSKQPRPELDEMKIEEMEMTILEAMEYGSLIEITTWKDGYFNKRCGYVTKVNPHHKSIIFRDELESTFTIDFVHLVGVERA